MQLTVTIWKKTISPWAYQQQQFAISRNWGVKKKIAILQLRPECNVHMVDLQEPAIRQTFETSSSSESLLVFTQKKIYAMGTWESLSTPSNTYCQ